MRIFFIFFIHIILFNSPAYSQSLKDSLRWLTGVQDRGCSPFITKTDHLGKTQMIGLYNGCDICFIRIDSTTIFEGGNGFDYLFFMNIDEDGNKSEPLLIPTNSEIYIADFDINLNNDLILYLYSDDEFLIDNNKFGEGYSILSLSSSYNFNWVKSIEGCAFATSSLASNDQIYSSRDQIAINSQNDIIFIGRIPLVYTDEIIDSFIFPPDTFYFYDSYVDTLILDGDEFTAKPANFFLSSLNYDGQHKWTKVYDHETSVSLSGLSIDKKDNIAICGRFRETEFIMESDTLSGIDTLSNSHPIAMFVSTYSSQGEKTMSNRYYQACVPKFITYDYEGNLLIASEFHRDAFIEGDTISTISPASDQLFVSIDPNGNIRWRERQGENNTNQIVRVKYTSDGDIIASGEVRWPHFLYKYDNSGKLLESIRPDVNTNVHGLDIEFTSNGTLIATGTHLGNFLLGPYALERQQEDSWGQYIAAYNGVTDPEVIDSFLGNINAIVDSTLCYGSTGSISISSSIGMDWIDVSWSTGDSTTSVDSLSSGNYTVTRTDIYNNIKVDTFFIPETIGQEIVYNGIDDDCNTNTLDDDLDQDGFNLSEDCDDLNPDINPDIIEIEYNGLDDDCDANTLDDDLDQDGYNLSEDCDDLNSSVNPGSVELTYNGIDDDCNENTLDDDLDQDGYNLSEDCDDLNPDVNPIAEEIPNNGIDENCDGEDLMTSANSLDNSQLRIYPNPSQGIFYIKTTQQIDNFKFQVINAQGLILSFGGLQTVDNKINLNNYPSGLYLLKISFKEESLVRKLIVY